MGVKKSDQIKTGIARLDLTCAFGPESSDKLITKAGLLTYSTFCGLPVPHQDSGIGSKRLFTELTASGNVLEFHRVPF